MRLEEKLEKSCREYATEKGYIFVKLEIKGWPDRMLLRDNGRTTFIELKTEQGRLTALQRYIRRVLKQLGFPVHVCKSLKQFKSILCD